MAWVAAYFQADGPNKIPQDIKMSDNKKAKRSQDNANKSKNAVANKPNTELKVADMKKGEVVKKNTKKNGNQISSFANNLLWLFACVLLIAAIGGNYYYTKFMVIDESSFERLGRVAIVIAVIVIALGSLLFTNKGRSLVAFSRESYIELRKVVWPTRQEALQTTVIVFIAVCLVSLFLYLADLVFLQIVRIITL